MLAFVVAALLGSALPQSVPAADPPTEVTPQSPGDGATVTLGDVEVIARPRGDTVRAFVNEVAASPAGRGMSASGSPTCAVQPPSLSSTGSQPSPWRWA